MEKILKEIAAERARQDTKWGPQNHPDLIDRSKTYREVMEIGSREACDQAAKEGKLTFEHILEEELNEAYNASGPHMREELIQSAAVLVAWIEAIDRRAK